MKKANHNPNRTKSMLDLAVVVLYLYCLGAGVEPALPSNGKGELPLFEPEPDCQFGS